MKACRCLRNEDPPLAAIRVLSLLASPLLFVGVSMTATDIVDSDGASDVRLQCLKN